MLIPTGASSTISFGLATDVTLNTLLRSSAEKPLSSIAEPTPSFTAVTVTSASVPEVPGIASVSFTAYPEPLSMISTAVTSPEEFVVTLAVAPSPPETVLESSLEYRVCDAG